MGLFRRATRRAGRGSRLAVSVGLVLGVFVAGSVSASAAGQKNAGDVWLDNVGQPPGPGHEHDPHLACADINVWGNGLADGSGTYVVDGWPPSGTQEQVYPTTGWAYNTAAGGDQVTSVISVQTLIANAVAAGDVAQAQQGFHFKLQFSQDPQKHKTFWVNCPQLSAFVGYADTLRADGVPSTPDPWAGSPHVTFVGCGSFGADVCRQQGGHDAYDAGAVRVDNTGPAPFTVSNASVVIGACTFTPWTGLNVSVPAGGTLVLTETGGTPAAGCSPAKGSHNNFDTSENGTASCTDNGVIPHITFSVDGTPRTLLDTGQVLNTGGLDKHACVGGNEGHAWAPIS
jgi:hypothetical protein